MPQPSASYRRAGILLLATLALYGVLVATHRGEFWPFSIYPMFSSAGRTWTRVIVRDVSQDTTAGHLWEPIAPEALPGRPVPLDRFGLSQNDLSVFVEHTDLWSSERRAAFHELFAAHLSTASRFMVYRVVGTLAPPDSIAVKAFPVGLLCSKGFYPGPTDAN